MVYETHPLREPQARRLADRQFLRSLKKAVIPVVVWIAVCIAISDISAGLGIAVGIATLLAVLPLRWRAARRVWQKECESTCGAQFLTLTDAGILSEKEGVSVYYPWEIYRTAELAEGCLLLVLPNGSVHLKNIEHLTDAQREELLSFAAARVGKAAEARISPPRSVLPEIEQPELRDPAAILEMGDILYSQQQPKRSLRVSCAFTILCALFTGIATIGGIESEWQECTWIFGSTLFLWCTLRGLLYLRHPGRRMLLQMRRAYQRMDNGQTGCRRDARGQLTLYPGGAWIRFDHSKARRVIYGQRVCVASAEHTHFCCTPDDIPPALPKGEPYRPSLAPFRVAAAIVLLLAAAFTGLCYYAPGYPLSYLSWLLFGNLG